MFLQVEIRHAYRRIFLKLNSLFISDVKQLKKLKRVPILPHGSESCKIELFLFAMSIVLKHRLYVIDIMVSSF